MKNFSLSLYAFHLRHTLTQLPNEVVADANLLWENLVKVGETSLPFVGLKDLRSKLICYQNNQYNTKPEQGRKTEWLTDVGSLDLGSLPTPDGFNINANLQPFLFNDTYAVDLTLVPESLKIPIPIPIDIPQLQHFHPLSLLPANIQASLGQTLWIYGEVDPSEDCDTLAKKFAIALVAGTNLNTALLNKGKLFDSLLFEYQALDPSEPDNPAKQCQILIVINNNQSTTVNLAEKAYEWLLKLFWSYHKILYIYHLARQRYQDAREVYTNLENQIQKFNSLISTNQPKLAELKSLMAKIPQTSFDYTRCLQDLQTHHTAIVTNIANYEICLNNIKNISGNSPQSWQDFLNKECQKWQKQIETDINYLAPGQELFGQFVDTIRGIVETQQAERDRSLENTVQILGIGFGGGAIVSGVVVQHIDKINRPITFISPNNPPHPFYASLLLSFFATLCCMVLGWLITKRK